MSDFRQWFDREMRVLAEEGAQFALDYPEAARLLDPTQVIDRDPYVERLTEGFAYWTARIRETLDAEEDGLSAHLMEMLASGLEEPLPSVAVVRIHRGSINKNDTKLERGEQARGNSPHAKMPYQFRLLEDVQLLPVEVELAQIEPATANADALRLRLAWTDEADKTGWPSLLPFYLHGDSPVVWALRYALVRKSLRIEVRDASGWRSEPGLRFEPHDASGYAPAESLPSALTQARDFFCQDERFRFLRLCGLDAFGNTPSVEIRVTLEGAFPRGMSRAVTPSAFQTRVGLFLNRRREACVPLDWNHTRCSMPLRPMSGQDSELLDLVTVTRRLNAPEAMGVELPRFSAHLPESSNGFYTILRGQTTKSVPLDAIAIGGIPTDELERMTLAMTATWCDGNGPNQELQPKDFEALVAESGGTFYLEGLTRPSRRHRPPVQVGRDRLLAYAAAHFGSHDEAQRLAMSLRLAQWDGSHAKSPLIDAIQKVEVRLGNVRKQGVVYPQRIVSVLLRDTNSSLDTWERLGLLDVFGDVLFRVVQEDTDLGHRTRLELRVDPAGLDLAWEN